LGVDDQYQYEEFVEPDIGAGQIIAIGTDGIWEASDHQKNAYGIERFCEVIRKHAALSAKSILEAVFTDIKTFTLGARQEDDITLVIAKLGKSQAPEADYVI
jgi:sigma-B regulation protein RsbU (phosphoserine phosphatase)